MFVCYGMHKHTYLSCTYALCTFVPRPRELQVNDLHEHGLLLMMLCCRVYEILRLCGIRYERFTGSKHHVMQNTRKLYRCYRHTGVQDICMPHVPDARVLSALCMNIFFY
jgi:hypothetical protein